jgi:hypothetical protein
MDIDVPDIHKYDEYVRGPAREVVTTETKIKPTNIGFAMLAKMGWAEGQPVGLSGDGTYLVNQFVDLQLTCNFSRTCGACPLHGEA